MKVEINELIRPELKKIKSYQKEDKEKQYKIDLSGNESPFDLPIEIKREITEQIIKKPLNTYPNLYTENLRCSIVNYLDLDLNCNQIIVGNGSDDVLDMLTDTFIKQGDFVLALAPTFSMYKFFTVLSGGNYYNIPLTKNTVTFKKIKHKIDTLNPKMIFLCSPNNPTGEMIDQEIILRLAESYKGILVIDEAYADFSNTSVIRHVNQHTNLAVTRTFSKAFGLAGIRLGYLVGSKELIEQVNRVLKPYNINSITSMIGRIILKKNKLIEDRISKIIKEREKMLNIFSLNKNWDVYPSSANFIYIKGEDIFNFAKLLNQNSIKIRIFKKPKAIRITIGKPKDNKLVVDLFKDFKGGKEDE
ncbi:MAG: histidinol-phosphate transaminase [Halanaerobiales bacterium]|nr:histidinol-phosphate transaminase [Halanaerobiales bacterium]